MKHSKRRRLTSEDFNKALGASSTEVKLSLLDTAGRAWGYYFGYLHFHNPGQGTVD